MRQEGTGRYDLHPVVRRYAYDRLADKEGTHTRLRDYFATVPEPEQVESLDDLAPTIELYQHTVRAGRYDEALRLLQNRLVPDPLYFRFGAYQLIIDLLRALFPGGEPLTASGEAALPRLSEETAQAWTLNALANAYALSGQPGRAVPLFEASNAIDRKQSDKEGVAIGLGNLATQQLVIGALAATEETLRRMIALGQEIRHEFRVAIGHQRLGLLLTYCGEFGESERELALGLELFLKVGSRKDWVARTWAYRSLRALFISDSDSALECAMKALEYSVKDAEEHYPIERDFIVNYWLLGAAHRAWGEPAQAEPHLEEALRRCRRVNAVYDEPNILLELARLRQAQGRGEALSLAREALEIADRCEYRLVQADCHNFLAQLALESADLQKAREHAKIARERAWCDGPPHRYEAAFREAERLLEKIGSLKH